MLKVIKFSTLPLSFAAKFFVGSVMSKETHVNKNIIKNHQVLA